MRYQGSSCRYYRAGQQLKRARHKVNLHPSFIANILGHKDPGIVFGNGWRGVLPGVLE